MTYEQSQQSLREQEQKAIKQYVAYATQDNYLSAIQFLIDRLNVYDDVIAELYEKFEPES